MVGIAQLVRASVCGTEGRRFEPDYLPQKPEQTFGLFYINKLVCF
jgi:hypothetical protein